MTYGVQESDNETKESTELPWPIIFAIVTFGVFVAIIYSQKTGTENNPCATQYWQQRDDDTSYTHSSR